MDLVHKIAKNDQYGRYLTAARDIKQGEIIIKESPLVIGPRVGLPMVCFNCCQPLETSFTLCPQCGVALLCSSQCNPGKMHTSQECQILKTCPNIKGEDLASNPEIILPLRCLLLLRHDNSNWNSLMQLESHLELRRNTSVWKRCKNQVEEVLKTLNYLGNDEEQSEIIQKICGIIDVNAFELRPPQNLQGLYPVAAIMAHDCIANTHGAIDDDFILSVRAAVDIRQGEAIYFNYGSPLQGIVDRKKRLKDGKYFDCKCRRCVDGTELGTEMSSLHCPRCHKDWIRPILVGKNGGIFEFWNCSSCNNQFRNSLIDSTVSEGRRRVHDLDSSNIGEIEKLLKIFATTFHPNHFLNLELEQMLIRLYHQQTPNKKTLTRQIQLCAKLLKIFRKVEPGISRIQAITLYQLHSAQVSLAQKDFNSRELTGNQFVDSLLEAECNLKTATKLLLYEPQRTPEGKLAQKALSELKILRLSLKNIQKSLLEHPEVVQNSRGKKKTKNEQK